MINNCTSEKYSLCEGTKSGLSAVWGFCAPKSCKASELAILTQTFFNVSPLCQPRFLCSEDLHLSSDYEAILVTAVMCALGALAIVGTMFEAFHDQPTSQCTEISTAGEHAVHINQDWKGEVIRGFAVQRNMNDLGIVSNGEIRCLHGIRTLSMWWAICGRTVVLSISAVDNGLGALHMLGSFQGQLVNSSALAADTFLTLSGLLLSLWFFKKLDPRKWKLNSLRNWSNFYFRRLLRICPTYFMMLGFAATLFPYLGNGPLWIGKMPGVLTPHSCRYSWWTNIMFLNNYFAVQQPCMGWSWFIAVEMQLFVFSPVLLILYRSKPKLAYTFSAVLVFAFAALHGYYVASRGYPPAMVGTENLYQMEKLGDYFTHVFIKPYTHVPSYLIGLSFGYFLTTNQSTRFNIKKRLEMILWLLAIAVNFATVFGVYQYAKGDRLSQAIYRAVSVTMISYLIALVAYVGVEAPFINLRDLLFRQLAKTEATALKI
ncbi:unnamed protein product [Soboliphyme baturini]|uniref:Acyl_transf_3 domain-containing protein n=1 Tax=Soboliphyme baturini TaxID=241478 RepID=A0A183INP8_9BILA|nr:unnamed protein product [Soboliphyme baturini]